MKRLTKIAALCVMLLLIASPALAQDAAQGDTMKSTDFPIYLGSVFAVGLVIIGAGYGISKIGSCAVESMARQPEVAGNIQTAMIISAALIEGATFFGLIVCMQAKGPWS